MKLIIIITILLLFLTGCTVKETPNTKVTEPTVSTITSTVSGINDLLLTDEELNNLGLSVGTNCTVETYETSENSPLNQYGICNYTAIKFNNTEIIVQYNKLTNVNDLNGSYQYNSGHLFGSKGFMDIATIGDQSKFHVNSEDDYGADMMKNDPNTYYHLWFTKDVYMIHITSKGSHDINQTILQMGRIMVSRFE